MNIYFCKGNCTVTRSKRLPWSAELPLPYVRSCSWWRLGSWCCRILCGEYNRAKIGISRKTKGEENFERMEEVGQEEVQGSNSTITMFYEIYCFVFNLSNVVTYIIMKYCNIYYLSVRRDGRDLSQWSSSIWRSSNTWCRF